MERRSARIRYIRANPDCLPDLRLYYRENPADFINDFGVTYDPRNAERGLPTLTPFVLFDKQREWIDYVLRKWRSQEHGLTEKSRDCGVTWLSITLSCTLCLFHRGLAIGFGSRVGDLVDRIGTLKPILPKGRLFLEHLPEEFRGGWVAWRDAPFMRINFPDTGSLIVGESGDQIGRGDREAIYFVDEAQPLSAKVLTPSGWGLMADMSPGCEIIGSDGRTTSVTHINECGVHDVYRVTFSDGTSTECSPNHLWRVEKVWGGRETLTLRTRELAERIRYESPGGQIQYRFRVPSCAAVQFNPPTARLPLDPYLLGAMLGDGSLRCGAIRITTADAEIVNAFRQLLPVGVIVGAFDGRYSYNIVDSRGRQGRAPGGAYVKSTARLLMAAVGIENLGSPEKFIPDAYKFAASSDRVSLLQGLMDTDGSAAKSGAASFYTTSPRLAEDVRFLVESLGGTAWCNIKPDYRGYRDIYALQIALPAGIIPFRLARKLAAWKPRKHPVGRTIVAVDYVGRRPVRCITVAAADGLYLTDHCIVTHNSAYLERPQLVEMSLSQTTNCRQDISSVNGMNNPFAQKRWGGKIDPFIFDWRDDPRKDDEWYERQKAALDPVVVAQEIDRDYSASVSGIVVPGAWVKSCINACQKLGIEPTGAELAALDVADEGVDKNALCGTKGVEIQYLDEWSGKGSDLYDTAQRAVNICDEKGYRGFRYDADGLGAGIRGDIRVINEKRTSLGARAHPAEGWRGSEAVHDPDGIVEGTTGIDGGDRGRSNKDYFANRKAQGWWELRRRAQRTHRWVTEGVKCSPDDILSISSKCPLYMKLVSELSQPTYKTNEVGKILINKKPDGMASPNLGDAAMIRYAPGGQLRFVVTQDILQRARTMAPRRRH